MTRLRYLVGLATLVGAALAGWWLIDLLRADGHEGLYTLRLEFRDVRGLRAGADVKHRGVPVGSVRRIELREDGERAVVDAVLEPAAARLVRYGSKFWIVTPRFLGLAQGATGLDTLIRDAYVSFLTPPDAGPGHRDRRTARRAPRRRRQPRAARAAHPARVPAHGDRPLDVLGRATAPVRRAAHRPRAAGRRRPAQSVHRLPHRAGGRRAGAGRTPRGRAARAARHPHECGAGHGARAHAARDPPAGGRDPRRARVLS